MARFSKWSWLRIRTGRVYRDIDGVVRVPVDAKIRRWHPGYWLFVARFALKHVRIRIERAA